MMLDLNYEPAVLVEDITMLTEEEWLRQRTKGIGGSDVRSEERRVGKECL